MSVHDFVQALRSKDQTRFPEWFADDMRLYTPTERIRSAGRPPQ
jgi:hypothetical protein